MAVQEVKKSRVRRAIDARMKEREVNRYKMTQRLDGKVSRTAIYRFLNNDPGAMGGTSLDTIEHFLDELDLVVVPKEQVRK